MRYSQRMSFEERIALIERGPDQCWIWPWAKTPSGYGHFRRNTRDEYAHRATYELMVGRIPKGADLDHECENPSCCNPWHLKPRLRLVHVRRHHSIRTHCYRGHPLLPVKPDTWRVCSNGARTCMACYRGWIAVRWNERAAKAYRESGKRRGGLRQAADIVKNPVAAGLLDIQLAVPFK
jgi:hypothetical protein